MKAKQLSPDNLQFSFELKDYWQAILFVTAMVMGAIVLYRGPAIFGPIMQAAVLALFFRSKNSWLWIAVFMFTSFVPGGLYQNAMPRNLVIMSTSIIGDLTFTLAFAIIALLKSIKYQKVQVFYRTEWILVLVFVVILYPIFGGKPTLFVKGLVNFSLLISIPMLLRKQSDYNNLFMLIFISNVFVLITNIYQVSVGYPIVRPLSGSLINLVDSNYYLFRMEDVSSTIRPVWGVEFAFLSIIGALFYITYRKSPFRNTFLYMMILIGWINVVFSATRGWIIASSVVILLYTFIMIPRLFRSIMIMLPLLMITFLGLWQIPVVKNQLQKSFSRLQTSESILSGDFTIEATGGRSYRNEIVMSTFRESPIIGWGHSADAMQYFDTHTGNQTILMQFGIIGYLLLLVLWVRFSLGLMRKDSIQYGDDSYKNTLRVPVIGFLGIFIIHSTSGIQLHPFTGGIFVSVLFSMGNFLYYARGVLPVAQIPKPREILET